MRTIALSVRLPDGYAPDNALDKGYGVNTRFFRRLEDVIDGSTHSSTPVMLSRVTTYDGEKNAIGTFYLPVQALSLGNSVIFNFRFEDNYSAGRYLTTVTGNNVHYRLSREAPYGDAAYGEAVYLGFDLLANITLTGGLDQHTIGNNLPLESAFGDSGYTEDIIFSTGANPIVIYKSSRDAINITYQIHFVTNKDVIFGEAFPQYVPYLGSFTIPKAKMFFFRADQNEINSISGTIPPGGILILTILE